MYKNYTNYNFQPFNPKKAVKSFQDLEVYQKALEGSVFVGKTVMEAFEKQLKSASESKTRRKATVAQCRNWDSNSTSVSISGVRGAIIKNAVICALSIPHQLAESHSVRFGESNECLLMLDKVMLNCNKMIVYLEQVRDICELGLEVDQFGDQINKYQYLRRKTLNLQRVWKKYIQINKEKKP